MASYYPEDTSGDEAAPSETDSGVEGGDEQDTDEKMDGPTALIPKTLLAGKEFKPGEEVVMKIVHDHGDEVEIAYATEPSGGTKDGDDGDSDEMKGAMGKLDSVSRY